MHARLRPGQKVLPCEGVSFPPGCGRHVLVGGVQALAKRNWRWEEALQVS